MKYNAPMKYNLFIDDERFPAEDGREYVIVRSSEEAIEFIKEHGIPTHIAWDHDLGGDDNSRRVVAYIMELVFQDDVRMPPDFTWSIHSQNPIGARWIDAAMRDCVNVDNLL